MDYIELRKRKVFDKYHDSDIFNTRSESNINKSYRPPRYKTAQPSLEKTKSDIFNTKEKGLEPEKRCYKKRKINLNNYKSDIFNIKKLPKNKKSCQRININYSTCFNGIKNDEEYNKDLYNYTLTHRPILKRYEIEKYVDKESATNRYYKELYGDEKSRIFPKVNKNGKNSSIKDILNTFKNNMKNFEIRKKRIKKEILAINDVGVDGKKEPGVNIWQEIDSIGNRKIYNKRKIDIFGNEGNPNNKNLIKENNSLFLEPKLNRQLDCQSNIFNDKNKNINKKMDDFINNKIQENYNKVALKEKIKKEREEMAQKIKELKKQNVNNGNTKLYPTSLKWYSLGAQRLLRRENKNGELNKTQEEMTAFQRKILDLSNSDNIDILSKNKKSFNIKKLKKNNAFKKDDNNIEKIKEILNTLPDNSIRQDQKAGIINLSTTSNFFNESKNDEKLKKYYNTINTNIKSARKSRSKKKKDSIIKIMGKNSKQPYHIVNKNIDRKDGENRDEFKIHDFTLVYPTKDKDFEIFENDDIKKIFGTKGLYIFDVKKNELPIGDLNSVKFKVREGDENTEKNIEEKIKKVEDILNRNKFRVKIKKDEIKKITKDNRNIKENGKYVKTPYRTKTQKKFTSQFPRINLKYKNFALE